MSPHWVSWCSLNLRIPLCTSKIWMLKKTHTHLQSSSENVYFCLHCERPSAVKSKKSLIRVSTFHFRPSPAVSRRTTHLHYYRVEKVKDRQVKVKLYWFGAKVGRVHKGGGQRECKRTGGGGGVNLNRLKWASVNESPEEEQLLMQSNKEGKELALMLITLSPRAPCFLSSFHFLSEPLVSFPLVSSPIVFVPYNLSFPLLLSLLLSSPLASSSPFLSPDFFLPSAPLLFPLVFFFFLISPCSFTSPLLLSLFFYC